MQTNQSPQQTSTTGNRMTVEIWSDVVCPWCYIGKRRIENALAGFAHADEVEVHWRSYQLDPGAREHWESWSASAQKLILTWIVLAKRPETRAARVETTAEKAALGEKSQG